MRDNTMKGRAMTTKHILQLALLGVMLGLAACGGPTKPPPDGDGNGLSISGTVTAPEGGDVETTAIAACFERDCKNSNSRGVTLTASGSSANFQIGDLVAGSYRVAAFKDVNGNGTLDAGDYASAAVDVTPPATNVSLTMQVRGDSGGGGGGGGNPGRYSGTLIAEGPGGLQTLDLNTLDSIDPDSWVTRDGLSVYEAASVVLPLNEVYIANDSFGSPLTVEVKDLTTFGLKETFEWEYNEDVGRVDRLAVTQDGKYLAALLEQLGGPYLEVLARDTKKVVYSGLDIVSSNLAWTKDNKLVFALDISSNDNPDQWGAIGAIPLERFLAATDEKIDIDLYATFNRAEWELGVADIAVSQDDSQLVYTLGTDLWVMDFTPGATAHQLTTGPVYTGGAQFSPDSKAIAFATGSELSLKATYIIPNHRSEPLFISYGQSGDEYLTGVDTLVDTILAWKP